MIITFDQEKRTLKFNLRLEEDENSQGSGQHGGVNLINDRFCFHLPTEAKMHPDLLASAVLSVVMPFARRRIRFPFEVSSSLAEVILKGFGKELLPISSQLTARRPGSAPGLSFSGGIDSMASLRLMPENRELVFFERIAHPEVRYASDYDTYQTAPALRLFERMEKDGFKIWRVQSDHQYVISPGPDWVTWIGAGSPLMLLADTLDLDSSWFGSDLGSTFIPHWTGYRYLSWDFDDPYEDPYQVWMSAIGLPISRPVSGMAGPATAKVVKDSPYREHLTFCANGIDGEPCLSCLKCLRKMVTFAVVWGIDLNPGFWDHFSRIPEIRYHFEEDNLLESLHVYKYCFDRLPAIPNRFFRRVQESIRSIPVNVDFSIRWYPNSSRLVVPKYRDIYEAQKNRYLEDYTQDDLLSLQSWPERANYTLRNAKLSDKIFEFSDRAIRSLNRRWKRLLNDHPIASTVPR